MPRLGRVMHQYYSSALQVRRTREAAPHEIDKAGGSQVGLNRNHIGRWACPPGDTDDVITCAQKLDCGGQTYSGTPTSYDEQVFHGVSLHLMVAPCPGPELTLTATSLINAAISAVSFARIADKNQAERSSTVMFRTGRIFTSRGRNCRTSSPKIALT